ncbi:MAG: arsenate reductase (glutaredoxin), partial [Verrucomicrobiales bacterium]
MKLLNDNNTDFDVVEYLKNPLSENEILVLAKKLGKRPKEFIRTSEKDFKENNIKSLIDNDRA